MSVEVRRLVKIFGDQKAVDRITFTAKPGDIMGFLGPNGAGKSTTMKIITGYLPPTEGTVRVCGFDVQTQTRKAQKKVGYLPENNPLYLDMYVVEYLRFAGNTHGLSSSQLNRRIPGIIEQCGLGVEEHKKIGALSKGYRQRVGLAQALLHDPPVLILDEPTTGLDPNQIVEIRKLIKEISTEKTVLFSTHILQEVQAICNKVVIINKGRIVANDVPENLRLTGEATNKILVEFKEEIDAEQLMNINGVLTVERLHGFEYRITSQREIDVRPALFMWAANNNAMLVRLHQLDNSIEDVFRALTQQ